jgi:hypothetical protein
VVSQAALELGVIQGTGDLGADVYAATEPNLIQLTALLKKAGRDLVDEANWTHLRQEYAILTESPATAMANGHQTWGAYVLPTDWRNMVDQSGWNRTTRLPLSGPLSEQEWQYLASRLTGVVWTVLFRPMQGLLYLYPSSNTPAGQEIVMAYKSSNWAITQEAFSSLDATGTWKPATTYSQNTIVISDGPQGAYTKFIYRCVSPGVSGAYGPDPAMAGTFAGFGGGPNPYIPKTSGTLVDGTCVWNWVGAVAVGGGIGSARSATITCGFSDTPSSGVDQLMFDEALLVAKLKLLWLNAKGFDSEDAKREYTDVLSRIISNDQAAPKLNLTRGNMVTDRLMGGQNFPITGYGS